MPSMRWMLSLCDSCYLQTWHFPPSGSLQTACIPACLWFPPQILKGWAPLCPSSVHSLPWTLSKMNIIPLQFLRFFIAGLQHKPGKTHRRNTFLKRERGNKFIRKSLKILITIVPEHSGNANDHRSLPVTLTSNTTWESCVSRNEISVDRAIRPGSSSSREMCAPCVKKRTLAHTQGQVPWSGTDRPSGGKHTNISPAPVLCQFWTRCLYLHVFI